MIIDRTIINDLKRWKESAERKPILLKGARQIGKTWVMKQFGKDNYDYTAFSEYSASTWNRCATLLDI